MKVYQQLAVLANFKLPTQYAKRAKNAPDKPCKYHQITIIKSPLLDPKHGRH
jgi:hypothetical protein